MFQDVILPDFIKGMFAAAGAAITLIYLGPSKHTVLARARLGLSHNRRRRLDAVLRKKRWQTATAVELELAFADAFGYSLPAGMVRYVFLRQNVLLHARLLKACRPMVRLSANGVSLESTPRGVSSFRKAAMRTFLLATLPFLAVQLALSIPGNGSSKVAAATALVFASVWALFWGRLAGQFEAAHQVTVEGPANFPVDRQVSPPPVAGDRASVAAG